MSRKNKGKNIGLVVVLVLIVGIVWWTDGFQEMPDIISMNSADRLKTETLCYATEPTEDGAVDVLRLQISNGERIEGEIALIPAVGMPQAGALGGPITGWDESTELWQADLIWAKLEADGATANTRLLLRFNRRAVIIAQGDRTLADSGIQEYQNPDGVVYSLAIPATTCAGV